MEFIADEEFKELLLRPYGGRKKFEEYAAAIEAYRRKNKGTASKFPKVCKKGNFGCEEYREVYVSERHNL